MELTRLGVAIGMAALCVAMLTDSQAATRRRAPAPQCPAAGTKAVSFDRAAEGGFIAGDGTEVRLAGILASDSASVAAALRVGALTLAAEPMPDRYGRILANVFAGETWVQGELLRRGEALAAPDLANPLCAPALLRAEDEGRSARAGHWGDGTFALRSPQALRSRTGSFQIVEAAVVSASVFRGRAYINFGPDYKTDFTVTVAPDDMRAFRRAKFDVASLAGKRVRVRGWVESYNGPEMEIATPAAIEIVSPD